MTKVIVGMSGGVDSSVAALLLRERGFDVRGVTLLLTPDADKTAAEAKSAAEAIGIPHEALDLRELFEREIVGYFCREYIEGRTPNACVMCNVKIKFGAMLDYALKRGAQYVATGHYADVEERGGRFLLKSIESKKDQSYFLCRLGQSQLSRIIFPLAGFADKDEVRGFAERHSLPCAKKRDSLENCFVPGDDYASFIASRGYSPKPGDFLDCGGNVIGRHRGLIHYTVGQRKGLGAFGVPMFVAALDPAHNAVILSPNGGRRSESLTASELNWIAFDTPPDEFRALVKIRFAAKKAPALVRISGEKAEVLFDEPQLSVTPGQFAVFYDGDIVLGSGIII